MSKTRIRKKKKGYDWGRKSSTTLYWWLAIHSCVFYGWLKPLALSLFLWWHYTVWSAASLYFVSYATKRTRSPLLHSTILWWETIIFDGCYGYSEYHEIGSFYSEKTTIATERRTPTVAGELRDRAQDEPRTQLLDCLALRWIVTSSLHELSHTFYLNSRTVLHNIVSSLIDYMWGSISQSVTTCLDFIPRSKRWTSSTSMKTWKHFCLCSRPVLTHTTER